MFSMFKCSNVQKGVCMLQVCCMCFACEHIIFCCSTIFRFFQIKKSCKNLIHLNIKNIVVFQIL